MSQSATPVTSSVPKEGPLDVYRWRWLFIGISLLFLLPGLFFIVHNMLDPEMRSPVRLGIDFRGGTLLEYGFSKEIRQSDIADIRAVFDRYGYTGSVIQIQQPRIGINQPAMEIGQPTGQPARTTAPPPEKTPVQPTQPEKQPANKQPEKNTPETKKAMKAESAAPASIPVASSPVATSAETAAPTGVATIVSIRSKELQGQDDITIRKALQAQYGVITVLQKNSMGPALARELLLNGLLALGLAYLLIVGYLTFRFQFDFAVCAMVALVHDTLFLFGMFAMFGQLYHTEVDSLFITAVLTVVGFSVHDTIVVFDRIRENHRLYFTRKLPFIKIVNMSINQTLARSINTSLTALLTMLALYFLGGETTRDFVLAIIIGIAAGTYSSIFNASVLLAMWRNRKATSHAGGGTTTQKLAGSHV